MTAPWLVVAVGNPSRGDDALGPALAERLRAAGWEQAGDVEIRDAYQLQLEDLLALEGRHGVLFVDAAAPGAAEAARPVGCRPLAPAAPAAATAFSHALAPAVLLALHAKVLGRAPPPAWLLALPGEGFALGAPLSAAARRVLDDGEAASAHWLRERGARPVHHRAP